MKFQSFGRLFGKNWLRSDASRGRKSKLSRANRRGKSTLTGLEALEERTVMSVLPTPNVVAHFDVSGSGGNESAPSIAVDPTDPTKLFAAWTRNDPANLPAANPVIVEAAYSTDSGFTWNKMGLSPNLIDPTSAATNLVPFVQSTDATVAFDRNHQVYLLYSEHRADNSAGAFVLDKFDMTGNAATPVYINNVVREWIQDPEFNPTLAVDNNLPFFIDPDTGDTRVDPYSGNVYIAWSTNDQAPTGTDPATFNPDSIEFITSSDRSDRMNTFSAPVYINSNHHSGGEHDAAPRIVVSNGTANGSVAPGQVFVVYDDFFSGRNITPVPLDFIRMNDLAGGYGRTFTFVGGPLTGHINDALNPGSGPHIPGETFLSQTVNIGNTGGDSIFTTISKLSVSVSAVHGNLDQLHIELIAPNGTKVPLLLNRTDTAGNTIPGQGVTGANLGTTTSGIFVGTTFDDEAARSVLSAGAGAPFTGTFRPELGLLSAFNGFDRTEVNGTWTLHITDTRDNRNNGVQPTQFVDNWQLSIGSLMVPGASHQISSTTVRGALTAPYPLRPSVSPDRGIGPAPVIASDNTLGSYSPYQGRLYVAYVDRFAPSAPVTNPADNTDVLLMYSDDGGGSWTGPSILNDDVAVRDGFSEANYNLDLAPRRLTGRPQFQPNLAVDQSTGTVVATFYDARNDAARSRVAQYVAISNDGGNSFAPETFLNTPNNAFDEATFDFVTIEPVPDNQSGGNALKDATFAYGERQGLVVANGMIYALWSGNLNGGHNGKHLLDILGAKALIPAGPRIVSSTMGPIRAMSARDLATDNTLTFNDQFDTDGTPIVNGFLVYFDRPVDPNTFDASDVSIFYQDPYGRPSQAITTDIEVTPVFDETSPLSRNEQSTFGASKFLVTFTPSSRVGTYSYFVGPNINDRIRQQAQPGDPITVGNLMDQDADSFPGTANDVFATPRFNDRDTLPMIVPGPHVQQTAVNTVTTFTPAPDQLQLAIPPFPNTGGTTGPNVTISTLNINSAAIVQGLQVNLNLHHTRDADLVITLIGPDGTSVVLSNQEGGSGQDFINTVFSDTAPTAIHDGIAPFTGSFRPETPLSAFNGKSLAGAWRLRIEDKAAGNTGNLNTWSLSTVSRTLSDSQESSSLALNTGATSLDVIFDRDMVPGSVTSDPNVTQPPSTYAAGDLPKPVGNPASPTTSSIIVPTSDDFIVQDATVQLNIIYPTDADLEATLIAPNGTRIQLFANVGAGGAHTNFLDTGFDDSAVNLVENGTSPFHGYYRPQQLLGRLFSNGSIHSSGTWQLEIKSDNPGHTGLLNSWSLTLYRQPRLQQASFVSPDVPKTVGSPSQTNFVTNSSVSVSDDFLVQGVAVTLNATYSRNADLEASLIAPDGTKIQLFAAGDLSGSNLSGTEFDDMAVALPSGGTAPFTGRFMPRQALRGFFAHGGIRSSGTWTLQITDHASGRTGLLTGWTLTLAKQWSNSILRFIGPGGIIATNGAIPGSFVITANPEGTDPNPAFPRTYRLNFRSADATTPLVFNQSGTYALTVASSVQSARGSDPSTPSIHDQLDTNLNAGVDVLRGTASAGTQPVVYRSTDVPKTVGDASTAGTITDSTITVTDSYKIQGLTLQLSIAYAHDPDLEATLITPTGKRIQLFTNVGSSGSQANFVNTVFDDAASTPIQSGGPPFTGRFNPQQPLTFWLSGQNPDASGIWTLEIKDDVAGRTGSLTAWSLTLLKPRPLTGLGELIADQAPVNFRIFTMDPALSLSHSSWTAVGPGAAGTGSNRVGGIAVDPSDPSGNTVYIGGASGGVWKTTNFLTTDPTGPTYIPLTDFGPTFAINIGGLAVFGRNNDPTQSIVFAGTGEGDTGTTGVGFLRSMDGGATWQLLDSTTNVDNAGNPLPINSSQRDHKFVGNHTFKVLVDPRPTPSGQVIVYAAMTGPNGGVWRSVDTGKHWTLMRAGQVTDIVFDPNSGHINAISNPTGNLDVIYAAFVGDGVYISPNRGQVWNLMIGQTGDPLIQDFDLPFNPSIPVIDAFNPNGGNARLVLAKPELTGVFLPDGRYTGNALSDLIYEGWLYVGVMNGAGHLQGLYLTKDFGQNWTKIHIATVGTNLALTQNAVPTNDTTQPDYDVGGTLAGQGNYDFAMAIDPTNPNVIYLGGTADFQPTGLIRVDTTRLSDPHAFFVRNSSVDGGLRSIFTTDPVRLHDWPDLIGGAINPIDNPYINLIRDPYRPFVPNATFYVSNAAQFTNTGAGARWTPWDIGGTDQHRFVTIRDPLTGHGRLIIGDDQGVYTAVDNNGRFDFGIGTAVAPIGSRNGNLQTAQYYYGASQPDNMAAQVAEALFYGGPQDGATIGSDAHVLENGNLAWHTPSSEIGEGEGGGDGGGVATDQTGSGTVYQYFWPCCGGNKTDFFKVDGIGRTFGLVQRSDPGLVPDPQWPFGGVANFAVNPIAPDQAVISSFAGRIFGTADRGLTWLVIGDPQFLDGTQSLAQAFGAPQPSDPTGALNDFVYVGTNAGHIFVTFTGGGANGNQWTNISNGLDGSGVRAIVTNPTRGSREAYAVTFNGVYHMRDSGAANPQWENITGNLFSVMHNIFTPFNDPTQFSENQARYLEAVQADWRYAIPDDPNEYNNPGLPPGPVHPALYVGGEGGVYRSFDNGATWTPFPDTANDGAIQDGGFLPNAHVTDLDLTVGRIDPTTGHPIVRDANGATGPDVLLATTYGRGDFAIRISPELVTGSLQLDPRLPIPGGSDNGSSSTDRVTSVLTPIIDGLSEQSAFSNSVRIEMFDLTSGIPVLIGVDPNGPVNTYTSTDVPKTVGSTTQAGTVTVSNINITDDYLVQNLTLSMNLSYAQSTDLEATLIAPDGTRINLFQNVGTSTAGAGFIDTILDDNADTPIQNGVAPFTQSFRPTEHLRDLFAHGAIHAHGTWKLEIKSDNAGTVGTLNNWSLDLVRQVQYTTTDETGRFKIQVPVGYFKPDGSTDGDKVFGIRATDAAGTVGNIQTFRFRLDTTPFIHANSIQLDPNAPLPASQGGSDSGVSFTDKITNVIRPFIDGVVDQAGPVLIKIFDVTNSTSGVEVGEGFTDVNGNFHIQLNTGAFAGVYKTDGSTDGPRTLSIVATHLPTDSQPVAFTFTLDTQAPAQPPAPNLDPASDDGVSNSDHQTDIHTPTFIGNGTAGTFVTIFAKQISPVTGTTVAIATGTVDAAGHYSVTPATPFVDGTYDITAQLSDVAGNLSPMSAVMLPKLVIFTTPPAKPTVRLDPAYDSGVGGDNLTNRIPLQLDGTSDPFTTVKIFDGTTQIDSFVQAGNTNSFARTETLNAGVHTITVQASDSLGNVMTSDPLTITVDTTPPSMPTLSLDPAYDSGTIGDNITAAQPAKIDGTTDASTTVVITDNGTQIDSFSEPAGSTTFGRLLNLSSGTHVLKAVATDLAGNQSLAGQLTVTIDANALDADRKFIRQLYFNALGRTGTLTEWNLWLPLLNQINGRTIVASDIERSFEARDHLVKGWYATYLGRQPNNGEEKPWANYLVSGATEEQALSALLASQEYYNKAPNVPGVGGGAPTDTTYVQALYHQLLNRAASTAEANFWVGQVAARGRQFVAAAILGSDEYRGIVVLSYYINLLQRTTLPSQSEINSWVHSGLDITSIRIGFEGSAEFYFRVTGIVP